MVVVVDVIGDTMCRGKGKDRESARDKSGKSDREVILMCTGGGYRRRI